MSGNKSNNEMVVEFSINKDAFLETPVKKISNVKLVIEYENPQAYGYPEVAHWTREYKFNINITRRHLNANSKNQKLDERAAEILS